MTFKAQIDDDGLMRSATPYWSQGGIMQDLRPSSESHTDQINMSAEFGEGEALSPRGATSQSVTLTKLLRNGVVIDEDDPIFEQ